MTTLSMLLRNSINEQLRKTCPETFDPELPDYILLLLTNRKSKQEMMSELNIFLSPRKTQELVDWLFTEIDALKSKRKVPQTREKEKSKEHKKDKREKKKKKKSKTRREKSPIELSSDSDTPEPPPIIHGRRE